MSEVLIIPNVNIVMINVGVHVYLFNVLGCVYIIYMMVVILLPVVLIYIYFYKMLFAYACLCEFCNLPPRSIIDIWLVRFYAQISSFGISET